MSDAKPQTVEAAFDALLIQIYGEASGMDPQQRSDLRDFWYLGCRHGFLTTLNGAGGQAAELAAFTREVRVACEDFMRRMAERIETVGNA